MRTVDNGTNVIDSRDVIARIEELQDARDALAEAITEAEAAQAAQNDAEAVPDIDLHDAAVTARAALEEWDAGDDGEELQALVALQDEAEGYSEDWRHGSALIRESYFIQYAQELADDIGAIDSSAGWPCYCIDWDKAARQLKQDYTEVDFDGVAYWIR